jgi:hypothetical protein
MPQLPARMMELLAKQPAGGTALDDELDNRISNGRNNH